MTGTVSGKAVSLFAGLPPRDLEANVFASLYEGCESAISCGETPLP